MSNLELYSVLQDLGITLNLTLLACEYHQILLTAVDLDRLDVLELLYPITAFWAQQRT